MECYEIDERLREKNEITMAAVQVSKKIKSEVATCIVKKAGSPTEKKVGPNLNIRYLGIPICSKKISAADCNSILEKMVARIKVWSSRNLSYMGRITLINSVLIIIHSYWAQITILSKKLLKDVESMCRAFLWKGMTTNSGPGLVAWQQICAPKKAGGLGFRNIHDWNTAAMGKYVWAIATKKDNLFVKWINEVYLMGKNWWEYPPPTDCSWYWKRIVAVKNTLTTKIDQQTFAALRYDIKTGIDLLFNKPVDVNWSKIVWNRQTIPKHRVILWLIMLQKLRTKEQIQKFNPLVDETCLLCSNGSETLEHLFFTCHYSNMCVQGVKDWLEWKTSTNSLLQLAKWTDKSKLSTTRKSIFHAALAATAYHIWRVRNDALWNQKVWCIRNTVQKIKIDLEYRICHVMPKKAKAIDREWFMGRCTQ
ncbi:uncharacterized protein LOC133039141 [Cannabis sativa]|uniref:uncharacterized protein LOC133039141 n=1 Tax=Cannabis sativa TaxID=3483 RepID=UPI0029C9FF09|nr:uncharacterized protein LOC133039141 [Cannabis sativa]